MLFQTCQFAQAHEEYLRCFQLSLDEKESFMEWIRTCKREMAKEAMLDKQVRHQDHFMEKK